MRENPEWFSLIGRPAPPAGLLPFRSMDGTFFKVTPNDAW
jgi:hypothetical protein